jgi:hypothetical protein
MQRYAIRVEPVLGFPHDLNAATPNDDAASLLRAVTPDDGKEHLTVLALDTRGDVLGYEEISSGTVDACMLYPRDIFAWALQVPLTRFVAIAHNHPSGKVDLSPQDKVGSTVVAKVGALVGLDLAWSMVYTHRGPQWEVWRPEGMPAPGDEDARPELPKMPPQEPEPAPGQEPGEPEDAPGEQPPDEPGEDTPDTPEDTPGEPAPGEDDEDGQDGQDEPEDDGQPEDEPAPDGAPGGRAPNQPEVSIDAVRAALRRVIGK